MQSRTSSERDGMHKAGRAEAQQGLGTSYGKKEMYNFIFFPHEDPEEAIWSLLQETALKLHLYY